MEDKLGTEGFSITLLLGKLTGREERTYSEFQFHIYPATSETRSRHPWRLVPRIDSKRIARKILDPDNPEYSYRDKNKQQTTRTQISERERERENVWKHPYLYLAFASGVGIVLLGIGIYWLFRNKKKYQTNFQTGVKYVLLPKYYFFLLFGGDKYKFNSNRASNSWILIFCSWKNHPPLRPIFLSNSGIANFSWTIFL